MFISLKIINIHSNLLNTRYYYLLYEVYNLCILFHIGLYTMFCYDIYSEHLFSARKFKRIELVPEGKNIFFHYLNPQGRKH